MEPIISFKKFNCDSIKNFDLKIKKNCFLTILGSNNKELEILVKYFCGILKSDSIRILDDLKIVGVFSPVKTPFISNNVLDELKISAIKLNSENQKIINEIIDMFGLSKIKNNSISSLNYSEKQILIIASSILMMPNVLILDDVISNIDPFYRENVLKGLKRIYKKYNIMIINFTNNAEQSLYGNMIAIINNGNIIAHDKTSKIINCNDIFQNNKIRPPFLVDLSIKLKYYGLVDNVILNNQKLVDEIWK